MKTNLRLLTTLTLLYLFSISSINALPMNRKQRKTVKTVTMRILNQLITKDTPIIEPATTIPLNDKQIGHVRISSGELVINDLTSQLRNSIAKGKLSFSKLSRRVKIQANATFLENDIQYFLDYKIKKLRFRHKIFPKVKISIQSGYIEATGKVVLKKIPGNFLAFLSNEPAPFKAKFKVEMNNEKLLLKIIDGVVNGQTITEEFKNQVETWLNPIWDFNKAGFTASIEDINITTGQIGLSITMF